jgi:alpha-pyrone synthase
MTFITSIGTAVPNLCFKQDDIAAFMERTMQLSYENNRKLKTIFRSSGIATRHSVLEDYGKSSDFSFYSNTHNFEPFPSTEKRLEAYRRYALPLCIQAIEDCFSGKAPSSFHRVTHLLTVSCTGMYAPGLDIDLVKALGLRQDVQRTCINFMGCYAAFNALKIANSLCLSDPESVVLIVCAELCTLHFQKDAKEDNLLANALFADGAAAMLVESKPQPGWNLSPEIFHNALAVNGKEHMAWHIGNQGFEMLLSSYVPEVIRTGIKKLTETLLDRIGKKILEVIEHELGITKEQNEPAYSILRHYGNMSSATIVFVLHRILQQLSPENQGKKILSFAFGPGLTLESMVLKIAYHE